MKICCGFKLELPVSEFYYENGKPKGKCKSCRKISNKINFEKWRKTENGKLRLKENKKKYEQKLKEKNKNSREEKRKQKSILLKEKQLRKEQRELKKKDKQLIKEQKKLEYLKKLDYWRGDEWKEIKKQKEKKRQYIKWKRRWDNDNLFAIKVRLRNLVRNSFRKHGYTKFNKKTESIVGINYNEFKLYIESKFTEGMNWENRGEWHIDHIIPLSTANTEEDLIKLSHYTNLQPLWKEDNLSKSNKIL